MSERRLPPRCRRCRYSGTIWSWDGRHPYTVCLYILRRAEHRPCAAGASCGAYEAGRKKEVRVYEPV